ncbi:hypothetical protein ACFL1R_04930, partial [Candidatus Latescibacterota bacterium]
VMGIMISLGISLLVVTFVSGADMQVGLMYFLGGSVGALSVGRVRHRKQFYRSMFFVPLTMVIAVVSMNDWMQALCTLRAIMWWNP